MSRIKGLRRVFRLAFGRAGAYKEIDEELTFHLDSRVEELVQGGLGPEEARALALQEFGGFRRYREELRKLGRRRVARERRADFFGAFRQDLSYAARQLRRSRGFTLASVLTLAVGIGATTTIFGVMKAVILDPLPFRDPQALFRIYEVTPQGRTYTTSEPTLLDWQAQARAFEGIGAYTFASMTLTGDGEPTVLTGGRISYNLLGLLGLEVTVGRGFLAEEDQPEPGSRAVILGNRIWEERFGRDPEILGRTVNLDGLPHVVVGVMELEEVRLLDYVENLEFLVPMGADPDASRTNHYITAVGRLAPGVDAPRAQQDVDRMARALSEAYPASNGDWGARIVPLREWILGPELDRALLALFGAVGLLLLLACANVSNLLLARATIRTREMGIRAALGAGRGRMVRQLLTESLLLAGLGGGLGVALSWWTMPLVRSLGPSDIPRLAGATVNGPVLAFGLGIILVTCLLFGVMPSIQAAGGEVHEALKEGRQGGTARGRLRDLLVVGEMALAVVVLVGAGLLGRSFLRLLDVDSGYDSSGLYAVRLQLPSTTTDTERVSFFREMEARIRVVSGVRSVGSAFIEPLSNTSTSNRVAAEEWDPQSPEEFVGIDWRTVTPGFFEAMGIPLLEGRTLEDTDAPPYTERAMIVVSQALAETLWPGEDPIGRRLIWRQIDGPRFQVVGVVGNVRDSELDSEPPGTLYLHHGIQPWSSMSVLIRVAGDPAAVLPAVRREIRAAAPSLPIPEIHPLAGNLRQAVAGPRFFLQLFAAFAAFALILASSGVYGVMMFQVAHRTREIGLRVAVGARRAEVLRLVLGQAALRTGVGLALGLVIAGGATRLMASLLYQVSPMDLATFGGVAGILTLAALVATLVPATQATRVDPMTALAVE
jgi:putative ABC transport system permease protein